MQKKKHKNPLEMRILDNKFGVFVSILIAICSFVSCHEKIIVNQRYDNVDSAIVFYKENGNYRKSVTIIEKSLIDDMYRHYINRGVVIEFYPANLPINKYDIRVYRSNGQNDTITLWHKMIRIRGLGVIELPSDLEPLIDDAFVKSGNG